MTVRLGVDTGGTFTDFVLLDEEAGTSCDGEGAVDAGRSRRARSAAGLAELGISGDAVDQVVVGTTVATNAVLQRRGPTVALRDERAASTTCRSSAGSTRSGSTTCTGASRRRSCAAATASASPGASTTTATSRAARRRRTSSELRERARGARSADEELVVAVCLLFSYLTPDHEQASRGGGPGASLPDAADLRLARGLAGLARVRAREHDDRRRVRQADRRATTSIGRGRARSGGHRRRRAGTCSRRTAATCAPTQARRRPGRSCSSRASPAASSARRFFAAAAGSPLGVLARHGRHELRHRPHRSRASEQYASEFEVAWGIPVTHPLRRGRARSAPGGGSIAWIDKGGLLHVGPRSAGAEPGPVAYGTGGTEPTLTDANLMLGRLNPDYFLGGRDAARRATRRAPRSPALGGDARPRPRRPPRSRRPDRRREHGQRDPADRGRARPRPARLRADRVRRRRAAARPLGRRAARDARPCWSRRTPGLCSAFGAAIAQPRVDRVRTYYARSDRVDVAALAARRASSFTTTPWPSCAGTSTPSESRFDRSADLRYAGQNYELEVALPDGDLDDDRWQALLAAVRGRARAPVRLRAPRASRSS